jgi:hypothetical protein
MSLNVEVNVSGSWLHLLLRYDTIVSENLVASIYRVRLTLPPTLHGVATKKKTWIFTAVKTSDVALLNMIEKLYL